MKRIRSRIRTGSPATVIAIVALFFSLTGTAVAGALITGANVKNGTLTGIDLQNNTVGTVDIKNGSLLPVDFKPGKLPAGPQGPQGEQGPAGPQGPQGVAGLSNVEIVTKVSGVDSSDKSITAQCPAGKKLIGGGATAHAVFGHPKELTLLASYPSGNTWKAVAREASPYAGGWLLNAYAICANVAA
jgi:hypothetical protein